LKKGKRKVAAMKTVIIVTTYNIGILLFFIIIYYSFAVRQHRKRNSLFKTST
jgi:hypothetical protein